MDPVVIVVVVAAVVLVVGVVLVLVARARSRTRRAALRSHFGDEYDRVVGEYGQRDGERELRARLKRRRELEVRELDGGERDRFGKAWESAQATFVEHPSTGLRDADLLVQQVMRERGYPTERFEERSKMISVDHPDLVERYRSAHRTSTSVEDGSADTEDMRQAMVDHRYLFDALLTGGDADRTRRL
ncbi:hypothetical protein PHK61_01650 [Actinomycetospora lutea]|uniref:hypothetical protein n=1 Tax=Actinomycetospora lutea TaxID=663604 RepID=UPI0023654906|nr:hypothetical protein [Actinomycetospora lutea]MDD7937118.1 hypothetical protein [Actinomycetospora lutea]